VSAIGLHGAAAWAILRRDVQILLSYRLRVISQLLGAFFSLTLFYYISRLVRVESFASPDAYYGFAVVGLVILQVLNSTLQTPPTALRQELVAGTFERMLMSPFGPAGSIVSMLIFPFAYALVLGLVMLGFAGAVFGLDVRWETAALAVPLGLLGALAFAPFGVLLLAVTLVVKQALSGTTFIVAGISIVAGLYFPVSLLPHWIRWASDVQPFTPAVELMRNVLVGTPLTDPAWLEIGKLVGFAAVLTPVAIVALHGALRVSRRRGTIIEY
jgi:ABC-2 type transport system permease protein